MPYIGNNLATQFQAFATQTITGDGSTSYTLDRAVANGKELLVYINNVKQEEGSGKSYEASGTTITFSEAVASGDSCYLVYMGSAQQTVTAPAGSIVSSMFANSALTLPNTLDVDAGITVDNITIDGTEIDLSSGDLTIDVAGDIILDADGGDFVFKDGGSGDEANKLIRMSVPSHDTDEENVQILQVENEASSNQISFGGGTSALNAATTLRFLTASSVDTTTGTERLRIHNDGRISIANTSATKQFYAHANNTRTLYSDGWLARFHNDGNAVNLYGIEVFVGRDDGQYDNYAMRFCDGDGDEAGYIAFNSGTVTYGTFTAHHPCRIPEEDNDSSSFLPAYPYGTLLETTSLSYKQKNGADTERGIIYNVRKTQSANSRKVLGAYGNSMNTRENSEGNLHQVSVLGDGHILCNNAGGNISIGDGICSSSTAGIGQKATANPSMIIGIAQEDVTFSGSETKLVAVQYGLQQFIPWS